MYWNIVSGIFLIVPIVDIALAAPVLVQEKRQACANMADIPEYPVAVLGKRGGTFGEIEEVGGKHVENWFVPEKESSAAHGSSSLAPSGPGDVSMTVMNAPAPNPGPSTESDHLLAGMNTPAPNPGPSTESDQLLEPDQLMDAPLSSPVHPTWFHPDNELLGAHAPQPNTVPSNPSTEFDSGNDDRLVVEEPPSPTKEPPTKSSQTKGPVYQAPYHQSNPWLAQIW
ncbi:hypothetical protein F5888DRAFT_1121437 [Russula emetica]|nr:hypothetical protein F5888DRAFT_1121437 [Russula emetica]